MKRIFVSTILGLALASCGGPSICNCKEWEEEFKKERREADSKEARDAVEEKWEDKKEQCQYFVKVLRKEKSRKEIKEEAEKCS